MSVAAVVVETQKGLHAGETAARYHLSLALDRLPQEGLAVYACEQETAQMKTLTPGNLSR